MEEERRAEDEPEQKRDTFNLDRLGAWSCGGDGEIIPWAKLKPYLDPKGPVLFLLP